MEVGLLYRFSLHKARHLPLRDGQVLAVLGSAILAPYEPQVVVGLNSGRGRHWDTDGKSQLDRDARFAALQDRESGLTDDTNASGDGSGPLASGLAATEPMNEAAELIGATIAEKLSDIFIIPVTDIELANWPLALIRSSPWSRATCWSSKLRPRWPPGVPM